MLGEALRQEGVEPAQAVVGVGDIDELCFHTPVQEGAVDGLRRHDLAHVSDMNRPGGGYARGNSVRAALLKLLGDDVSPVNRHSLNPRLEMDINLIVA
ncbi:MAG: tRNA-specific adenosine deaminase [Euryarchaeota archaeon]|nr:tRNA-specific adenosine deaminase [Euryarchaeota archaeon]